MFGLTDFSHRFSSLRKGYLEAMKKTVLLTAVFVLAPAAANATSAQASPSWRMGALADTAAAPGETFEYLVQATNTGSTETNSEPIVLTGRLPTGVKAIGAKLYNQTAGTFVEIFGGRECELQNGGSDISCEEPSPVARWSYLVLRLKVQVDEHAAGAMTSRFAVVGGGAPESQTADVVNVTPVPTDFGIQAFDGLTSDASGGLFTQAAGNPDSASVTFAFTTEARPGSAGGPAWSIEPPKDVVVDLPPGFVGNPTAASRCTLAELSGNLASNLNPVCSPASQVGVLTLMTDGRPLYGPAVAPIAIYNLVPPAGVPARFGFNFGTVLVVMDASVRTGGGYGVTINTSDIPSALAVAGTSVTFWGVPASPAHDNERDCPGDQEEPVWQGGRSGCPSGAPQRAFLRMPTSCTDPGEGLTTTMRTDSWFHPGDFKEASYTTHQAPGFPFPSDEWGSVAGVEGCANVPFKPSFSAQPPVGAQADSPASMSFDIAVPQSDEPGSIAQADVRKTTVTLPRGVRINPSAAGGLEGCSSAQIDLKGAGSPACPEASKLGTVDIETPLLSDHVKSSIYLATPYDNPFDSLTAIYLVAEADGVVIKLPGQVKLDPNTGQITTIFDNTPQLPFSKLHLEFKSGPRTALVMPPACGTYTTHAELEGWNGKVVDVESPFTISGGAGATGCLTGFAPGFAAGTTSPSAGRFSPFGLSFTRNDSEQQIGGLEATLAPGLVAKLAGVARCDDAEASAGTCSDASRIGSVTVGSGAGSDPYFLKGSIYLTGPYNGGPFGVAVVVPAVAGPFNLGDVVVRGSIRVNPTTGQATVVSDPFPQFVNNTGIPTDVRRVDVNVDRPGFTLNPTNCSPLSVTAKLTSTQGASANVSSRFQASECRSLAFHPAFTASTQGKTSRREGASLTVKVAFKAGQANIAKVKVSLPKALPSRLDTLKLACRDAVFDANPAACPAASRVGAAVAKTPILTSALTGPAYIVSHGGAAFPDLEMVLQGEGVTLILDGKTDIKNNVTTSTFDTVPDVPVSNFELRLPEGVHSVLGAPGGNLCGKALAMPTTLTGQNGAVLRRSTHVVVSGCRPAIRVVGHSVRGAHARIRVAVPAAGTLVASGGDVGRAVKRVARAGTATIAVTLSGHDRHVLARNPRQRVNAVVRLRFKPRRGAPLSAQVRLLLG
jgi:hypothetical protein